MAEGEARLFMQMGRKLGGFCGRACGLSNTFRLATLALALLVILPVIEAHAETRTLKLYFLHTKEKAEITYKRNGRYLPGGLRKINRFLRDWRRNEPTKMDPALLDLVWEVHKETRSKRHIHVISAYRSPATNSLLRKRGRGVAKKSQHTLGKAMDFFIPGVKLSKLRAIALKKGLGGVGYYPKSGSPFVHMDTGRVRHWPRMSRRELARVFPRGKTLHVPTDGKPLPGYNLAKTEYERKKKGAGRIQIAKAEDIERRPGFFSRLLGRSQDEEDTSAPDTPVAKPAAPDTTKPAAEPPASPETVIAGIDPKSVPVPISAPRLTVARPEDVTRPDLPAVTEPSAIETPQAADPAEEQATDALLASLPLPSRAPRSALSSDDRADSSPQAAPLPITRPGNTPSATALLATARDPASSPLISGSALTPDEIDNLRREVYAALETEVAKPRNTAITTQTAGSAIALQTDNATQQPLSVGEPSYVTALAAELNDGRVPRPATGIPNISASSVSTPSTVSSSAIARPDFTAPIPTPRPARNIASAGGGNTAVSAKAPSQRTKAPNARTIENRIAGSWAFTTNTSLGNIANVQAPTFGGSTITSGTISGFASGFSNSAGVQPGFRNR